MHSFFSSCIEMIGFLVTKQIFFWNGYNPISMQFHVLQLKLKMKMRMQSAIQLILIINKATFLNTDECLGFLRVVHVVPSVLIALVYITSNSQLCSNKKYYC